jgi:hypothetical protein
MKRNRKFNNILDECLERLLVKGESMEQCLRSYPEQAAELEPLLLTALAIKKASVIQPHPEFRAKARYQFLSVLQTVEPKRRLPFFGWQPRWVTVVAIVLVLLLAGGGTVAVAGNSMPDEPLYPVKLATEQVQLALTPSALGKAELYAKLADKRVAEIVYVANKGKPEQVERVAQRLNSYLTRVAVLATAQKKEAGVFMAPPPLAPAPTGPVKGEAKGVKVSKQAKLRGILAGYAAKHPQALRAVLKTAPASAKPALRRAIVASVAGYKKAVEALD